MDPKMIEMNNLRVLNDYLTQTLDVLVRGPRLGNGHASGIGYSPFAGSIPGGAAPLGTDVVYGASPYAYGGASMFGGASPFAPTNPFTGVPGIGGGYGAIDPFLAQRNLAGGQFGSWQQQPWGQPQWGQGQWGQGHQWGQGQWAPISEATRQAHVTQALAAKQTVLEAMCRVAGIPV
jgi:hypothetical protein